MYNAYYVIWKYMRYSKSIKPPAGPPPPSRPRTALLWIPFKVFLYSRLNEVQAGPLARHDNNNILRRRVVRSEAII